MLAVRGRKEVIGVKEQVAYAQSEARFIRWSSLVI
jgi:hypothetical protein